MNGDQDLAASQRSHFLRRVRQRLGISLNDYEYIDLVAEAQKMHKRFGSGYTSAQNEVQKRYRTYSTVIRGIPVSVSYDPVTQELVTVLIKNFRMPQSIGREPSRAKKRRKYGYK